MDNKQLYRHVSAWFSAAAGQEDKYILEAVKDVFKLADAYKAYNKAMAEGEVVVLSKDEVEEMVKLYGSDGIVDYIESVSKWKWGAQQ